jgi:hypothetical protein
MTTEVSEEEGAAATALRVVAASAGMDVGNSASVIIDDITVDFPGGTNRGLNVVVFDVSSYDIRWARTFDTHASTTAADEFAGLIEGLPLGLAVAIAVQDDAAAHLTDRAKRACQLLGSCLAWNLGFRDSWALVGQRGSAPGSAAEQLSHSSKVTVTADALGPVGLAVTTRVRALSSYHLARIWWQDEIVDIDDRPSGGDGLNVVVADADCRILSRHHYDTGRSTTADYEFAKLIEELPEGRLVAIAVRGDWQTLLSDRSRDLCESLGSKYINEVDYNGFWSIVGFKGALRGSVAESWSKVPAPYIAGPALSDYWHLPDIPNATDGFSLSVSSAGYLTGDYAAIVMAGFDVTSIPQGLRAYGRGLNVVVFDENTGEPLYARVFDTNASQGDSDAFARLIEGLPAGRVVAVTVKDDASRNLTEPAKVACERLGSALIRQLDYRDSWALIGRKGAARGSVPEELGQNPVGVQTWFALDPVRAPRPYNQIVVHSAGYSFGNSASISATINPAVVGFADGYQRGLNVAVFNENTGAVLEARTFDTHQSKQASDDFADLIDRLPRGRVVAIAVKDEATQNLTLRARQAFDKIGALLVQQLQYRGSWAFVGKKGGVQELSAEALSNNSAASVTYWLLPEDRLVHGGFRISGRSAGLNRGNFCWIAVGGRIVVPEGSYRRGLNAFVINERDGQVLIARNFDTNASTAAADALAELIEGLPAGRIVALAAQDDAQRSLTERAMRACESAGSALIRSLRYRGSWVLIGAKAAAPGSAIERLDNDEPAGVCALVPYPAPATEEQEPGDAAALSPLVIYYVAAFVVGSLAYLYQYLGPSAEPATPVPGGKKFNEVTWLVAHNAFAARNAGFQSFIQQNLSIPQQLTAGVRGLALDVWVYRPYGATKDGLYLCHGFCDSKSKTLTSALTDVVKFLKSNPQEIVTIFIESPPGWLPSAASNTLFLESFKESGAYDLIFWPDANSATPENVKLWGVNPTFNEFIWPEISAMISQDKRLFLLVDRDRGVDNVQHIVPFVWRYVKESVFSDQNYPWPWDNTCGERDQSKSNGINRSKDRSMFLWNHFPYFSAVAAYSYVNSYYRLVTRAKTCANSISLVPNFLEIDFVDLGDGKALTDNINSQVWTNAGGKKPIQALNDLPVRGDVL